MRQGTFLLAVIRFALSQVAGATAATIAVAGLTIALAGLTIVLVLASRRRPANAAKRPEVREFLSAFWPSHREFLAALIAYYGTELIVLLVNVVLTLVAATLVFIVALW